MKSLCRLPSVSDGLDSHQAIIMPSRESPFCSKCQRMVFARGRECALGLGHASRGCQRPCLSLLESFAHNNTNYAFIPVPYSKIHIFVQIRRVNRVRSGGRERGLRLEALQLQRKERWTDFFVKGRKSQ